MSFIDMFIAQEFDGTARANQSIVSSIIEEREIRNLALKRAELAEVNNQIQDLSWNADGSSKSPNPKVISALEKIADKLAAL
jgi:hypothetical protein